MGNSHEIPSNKKPILKLNGKKQDDIIFDFKWVNYQNEELSKYLQYKTDQTYENDIQLCFIYKLFCDMFLANSIPINEIIIDNNNILFNYLINSITDDELIDCLYVLEYNNMTTIIEKNTFLINLLYALNENNFNNIVNNIILIFKKDLKKINKNIININEEEFKKILINNITNINDVDKILYILYYLLNN